MDKIEDLIDELYFISTLKPVKGMTIVKEIKQKEMKLIYNSFKEQEKLIIELKDRIYKATSKLQSMFNNGNEKTILDDLLELYRVLVEGE